jgi:hypothetical protein
MSLPGPQRRFAGGSRHHVRDWMVSGRNADIGFELAIDPERSLSLNVYLYEI